MFSGSSPPRKDRRWLRCMCDTPATACCTKPQYQIPTTSCCPQELPLLLGILSSLGNLPREAIECNFKANRKKRKHIMLTRTYLWLPLPARVSLSFGGVEGVGVCRRDSPSFDGTKEEGIKPKLSIALRQMRAFSGHDANERGSKCTRRGFAVPREVYVCEKGMRWWSGRVGLRLGGGRR